MHWETKNSCDLLDWVIWLIAVVWNHTIMSLKFAYIQKWIIKLDIINSTYSRNMNIIRQGMENSYWMPGDEKYSVWDEKYTGLVLIWNSNRLDIMEEKTSELDDITVKLSKMKYIEKKTISAVEHQMA